MGKRRCSVVAALATIMVVMVELAPLTVAKSGRSMLTNGLGMTPPMGWNSWNHFGCNIDEKIIRETADALVSTGLSKLGYEYVNIDDCWAEISRDDKQVLFAIESLALVNHIDGSLSVPVQYVGEGSARTINPEFVKYKQEDSALCSWLLSSIGSSILPSLVNCKNALDIWEKIWAAHLSGYRIAVVLLNRGPVRYSTTALWDDIGLDPKTVVEARDLWEHKTLTTHFVGNLTATLAPHSCKLYVLKPIA
ncbi:hypothetical protein HRI_004343900 [Hibiscus trionum]|uniref:Alpha-galactosidase n=1 Tax=Hibiscus trionum TaxID=183268 RepID=A0A9W7MN84_HIBTR|nr:hypothetical protein HRI_004343900 [Hibiscus trionum]